MTENWSKQSIVDAYNSGRRDFSREYFCGLDLRGITLSEADLSEANLSGADLSGADLAWANLAWANLSGADLSEADIDLSVWPMWCGSLGVKVDKRIASQLCYHFCAQDCDDPDYLAARNAVLDFANRMHRDDVPKLERRDS